MISSIQRTFLAGALALVASVGHPLSSAHAELILSQLIVELKPGGKLRDDIEVWNDSPERAYIAIEPSEIINAGQGNEIRTQEVDPAKRGLLVSPARLILEPGQRKLVRVAVLSPNLERERVYRVTVKPTAGELSAEESGLKILVGYDVLVLVRPADLRPQLIARRSGDMLTFRNEGNASLELTDGRQCSVDGLCTGLPGKRLYPGAEWSQRLGTGLPVEYRVVVGGRSERKTF